MNRSQSELDKLRAAHPEKWTELIAAGFKPQRIADIIQHHADEKAKADAANPPDAQALARVKAAQDIVLTHLDRARLSKAELDKLVAEVRAQFPQLQIEVLTLDAPGNGEEVTALKEVIEQLKKDKALQAERIQQLEDAATEQAKALAAETEAHNVCKSDAANQAAALKAANEKIANAIAAKSLKAAHEALV